MVSCTTPSNPDRTIDVCKLTEPPINAHIGELAHVRNIFIYPDPKKAPRNYSGCVKAWIGDLSKKANTVLVLSAKFNGGLVSQIVSFDTNGAIAVICDFDDSEKLIKETLVLKHHEGCLQLLPTAHELVNNKEIQK